MTILFERQRNVGEGRAPARILAAAIAVVALAGPLQKAAACDPNTQVCSTAKTQISKQQYRGASGSARVSFYPVPNEKGDRNGVSVWVFGFGPPKAPGDSLNREEGSGESAIDDASVPLPVRLGFDHYSVDFCDPTDYLQRNALVVRELIVDEIIPTLESGEKLSLLGSSMGGLVTRYVLTQLEAESVHHDVDLWVTNDSPHKGAYVPLGVQFLASIVAISGEQAVTEALALVDAPSPQQMLLAHHLSAVPGQPHRDHRAFFSELDRLGNFPQSAGLRTVAIASGAGMGKASHRIEGVTLKFPFPDQNLEVKTPHFEDGELKWASFVTVTLRGTGVVRLIPLTRTRQTVLRAGVEGAVLFNGKKFFSANPDTVTTSEIAAALAGLLNLPPFVPSEILDPVAEQIGEFVETGVAAFKGTATVQAEAGYENLSGGLGVFYADFGGQARHTFIPTFSALALDLPPGADLTEVGDPSSRSPFTEVVFQSRDRGHTASESDVGCREQRRLAGVPYITQVEPGTRVAGQGAFKLTVQGGNFTSQTVASWAGTKLPTTFINNTRLVADVRNALLQEPTTDPLLPGEPHSPVLPLIVSVNDYDSEGNLPTDHYYADEADCTIGVVVQENPLTIRPAVPSAEDQVTAVFADDWTDTCRPGDPEVAVTGDQITVTTTGGLICGQAITPYEVRATFGPLPAGVYELILQDSRGGKTQELGERIFEVTFPVPSISLLQPATIDAGGAGFTLKVEGAKFQPPNSAGQSAVYWNGSRRPTTFVSGGELHASIPAADIASPGTAEITVRTGETVVSEPATFTITEPPPAITSLDPGSVEEDSGPFVLTVAGERFAADAAALWTDGEGASRRLSTSVVSMTQLEASVPAALITTPGSYPVAVISGGRTSAAEYFTVEASDAAVADLPAISAATNGASLDPGVSPGGIATIFGENLAKTTEQAARIPLPTSLAGAQVLVNGTPAPLYYVSPSQINFQVPFETPLGAEVPVHVMRDDVAGPESTMIVQRYALGIFFYEREPGVRDPVITHADGSLVTPANPARAGEVVIVYATGVGGLKNPPPTGAASRAEPLAESSRLPQVILAGSSRGASGRPCLRG